jgi:VanZ family protein
MSSGPSLFIELIFNQINDFHLADTLGNLLGTIAAVFVTVASPKRTETLTLIKTITLCMVLYEIAQPLLGRSIDIWDILATLLTAGLCLILYNFIHPDKENTSSTQFQI